jgi:hypothetical protein
LLQELQNKLATEVPPPLTAEQWPAEFNAWADSHVGSTVLLSDEAMSRESIYPDRGLVNGSL